MGPPKTHACLLCALWPMCAHPPHFLIMPQKGVPFRLVPGHCLDRMADRAAHDLAQAKLLPQEHVQLKVFTCDSHRLAFILDQRGKLVPLLRAAILSEMGFCAGNVRLQNLL